MGEVYRARDLSLGREVALKLPPESVASDADRRARFEREARLVASLNHPNIVTIHSVEQADDKLFITMELVKGRPLAALIPRGGHSIDRLLAIAVPLAGAVAAAHERGITHRDLKPANVLVADDITVKVLDFGVAKRHDADAASSVDATASLDAPTAEGHIVGTIAYMSPDQAAGKLADARSDVFSLGTMLYEMATSSRAPELLERRPVYGPSVDEFNEQHRDSRFRRDRTEVTDRRRLTRRSGTSDQSGQFVGGLDLSHDGKRLAFSRDRDLWLQNVDGTGLVRLTNDAARDTRPAWSPDDTHLLLNSDRGGRLQIWSMNADGSQMHQVFEHPGFVLSAKWSPDGTRAIAYRQLGAVELLSFDPWLPIERQHRNCCRHIPRDSKPCPGRAMACEWRVRFRGYRAASSCSRWPHGPTPVSPQRGVRRDGSQTAGGCCIRPDRNCVFLTRSRTRPRPSTHRRWNFLVAPVCRPMLAVPRHLQAAKRHPDGDAARRHVLNGARVL
jgi:serine/threonine protein kinase